MMRRYYPCYYILLLLLLLLLPTGRVEALSSSVVVPPKTTTTTTTSKSNHKVLVLGGTGFLGQEIVKQLSDCSGVEYIALSRKDVDLTSPNAEELITKLAEGCTAVISTVGSLTGSDIDYIVNSSNQVAAAGAKKAGVERFVTIGNDPKVRRLTSNILKDYVTGKEESERVIKELFPNSYTIVQPSFIHGGDEFQLNPPRLPSNIGSIAEDLFGLYPFQSASEALPGILGVALQAPISRERVAAATINAALGLVSGGDLDCRDAILQAASKRPQTILKTTTTTESSSMISSTTTTSSSSSLSSSTSAAAETLKQQLYNLGDCGGEPDKLEQAFNLLEQIEQCNERLPTIDPTLNGRWDFCMDVEADIGTGVVKDILQGDSPIKAVFNLEDLYMVIQDNTFITIHVDTKVFGIPTELKLTTNIVPDPSDTTGTFFMEQFQGVELMGREFPIPKDWQRSRPLEFSYLDDNMLIARGNGAEPHYLKR